MVNGFAIDRESAAVIGHKTFALRRANWNASEDQEKDAFNLSHLCHKG